MANPKSGHFTKVGDDDYVGPSGKHFNYNQVRAYYSNGASYDGGLAEPRPRLKAVVRKFGGPGSGPHPGSGKKDKEPKSDGAAHTNAGKLPGYPHGTAASGTHAYTVTDDKGNEISHHDTIGEARAAATSAATAQNQNMNIRDNTGTDPHADGEQYYPAGQSPWDITTGAIQSGKVKSEQTQFDSLSPYDKAAYLNGTLTGETASYRDTLTGEGTASGASMDDAEGDRGDVAEPAIHMPRSMSSRCMACGCDLSVRDMKTGGTHCQEHAEELASPAPHTVPRPGGGITAPRAPMTSATAEFGGPGSGPQGGASKLLAKVKTTAKGIAQQFVKDYGRKDKPQGKAAPQQSGNGTTIYEDFYGGH